ncbi:MAG: acetate--CoA ligase [Solirubrobacteraceae bacterium]
MTDTATATWLGPERIRKHPRPGAPAPNVADWAAARAAFSWERARAQLDGLPGGRGLNIAHEAVDGHATGPRAAHPALRWRGRRGERAELTYRELSERSSAFAHVLDGLGVGAGDRVFALLPRVVELYVAALGTLKHRCVLSPLFSAFGPEPVRERLSLGGARVLVTTPALYRRKVAPIRELVPQLEHVLLVGVAGGSDAGPCPGGVDLSAALATAPSAYEIGPTRPEDLALLHFTRGTTGRPTGARHVHEAVVAHRATAEMALDLRADDVFWCTADPGWVTGTSYGIVAPLVLGATLVVDEGEFDAERWYDILERERETVWYTAPTAVRMLMRSGAGGVIGRDLSALRFVASVGEPLNPEAVLWSRDAIGLPIHDNWWQTETGGIMIANLAAMDIRPGSMGRPLPGVQATVLRRDADGELVRPVAEAADGEEGELALRPPWPSMFRGYLGDEERYRDCFAGGWYLSGDLVRRDADGYFWFVGRGDDVIKSAGHLIGPFEVESVLLEHPAVVDCGVIGKPDPVAGQVVKAFVVLGDGWEATGVLQRELMAHARRRLGAAVAPREIEVAASVPHTRSGKIMRRLLRARELGEPEGDTSTLESEQP